MTFVPDVLDVILSSSAKVCIGYGDGKPLTRSLRYNWKFEELPPDADIVSVQRYTRAYIMQLIGGFLFADKSNTLVYCMFLQFIFDFDQTDTYAWGVATLTWLYKEFYRASHAQSLEIAGSLMLLQVWTYDKFPIVAPQRTL
ncbi:serine/threonine-protein phosphatase 7 long form-like protein [Cucumis melo var. makuwa]|uniref:Serine/threonine-protein phosphatase 7 long form-like protein n=1 Tax=Cucumis melo var. makuwa TaxID=1194695 RepID=A0A5A7V3S7_CUCMM|nr:serine/threonine-protein phosphatase 7 long form-like protein [Cucumis melo var. makuwa]TYK23980.1 serine/threonine-protein phosphatase 7 long form-like protein [Cucumis melo var. makuwa]